MDNPPSPVGEILEEVLSRLGIDNKIKQLRILKHWKEIVGKTLARHSCPVTVRKGNLFVKVDSSGWLAQITYFKEKIISELNRKAGSEVIRDIYLSLGKVYPQRKKGKLAPNLRKIRLSQKDLNWIENTVKNVKDESLRELLRRILIKDKKLKKFQNRSSKAKN